MLVGIVAVLTALVVVLLWQMHRKDEDIKQKNDVIIHEVRRNQSIIDKAVAQGINRAALFTLMCAVLMAVTFTACTNQNDNPVAPDTPQQPEELADYTIIYYGHGGGNRPDDDLPQAAAARTRGVVYDDAHNTHFTVKSLAQAISAAKVRPAAVYLDACLMNSAEYLFELAPHTDYYVASTFLVPGLGGDYISLINALSQNPDDLEKALSTFAKATVSKWEQEEGEGDKERPELFDMSVIRTADLNALGWGSTLDATYGQLRFDQLTGWSRWLKVNQQKPNEECHTGFLSSMFDIEVGNE